MKPWKTLLLCKEGDETLEIITFMQKRRWNPGKHYFYAKKKMKPWKALLLCNEKDETLENITFCNEEDETLENITIV